MNRIRYAETSTGVRVPIDNNPAIVGVVRVNPLWSSTGFRAVYSMDEAVSHLYDSAVIPSRDKERKRC